MKKRNRKEIEKKFRKHSVKLIKFINKYYHPMTTIVIRCDSAELLTGEISVDGTKYVVD